ncbi:MAG: Stp1/IreP family PP2C-type Ser/Thr phosphatase [Blastocatellales bacterium]
MRYQVIVAHRTDTGRERQENQDSVIHICDEREGCHLLVVADGMGGTACGQEASQLATQTIRQSFFSTFGSNLTINQRLEMAVNEANRMILRRADRDRRCRGMGSTCAVLAVAGQHVHLAHAGDSRIYLIRDSRITQLTRDHSRAQRMLDDGLITEEEAANHPDRNWLDRALGLRAEITPDVRPEPIRLSEKDTFIVCTDGLTNLVRDEEIFRFVQHAPVEPACDALIALANERGGHDNITVAIVRVGSDITLTF